MSTKIYWFRHTQEGRNELLRFGLMQLHATKDITYLEKKINEAESGGYSAAVALEHHHHLSFLTLEHGGRSMKIIVDNEDSFIHCSAYLKEADYYFSAAFNADFYRNKTFPTVYRWQKEEDIAWYRIKSAEIIRDLGSHFSKVQPFIPITPNLTGARPRSYFKQKAINMIDRCNRLTRNSHYWKTDYGDLKIRYAELLALRKSNLKYDIILNDTLWGWPVHRIKLHEELRRLAGPYRIHSILKWHQPYECDGSISLAMEAGNFPLATGAPIENYEQMLSESKLAVFATGFHWGWRNIMTFALLLGIPVLTDHPLHEPYFDLNEFKLFYNEDGSWETIEDMLRQITPKYWHEIKNHNQQIYDRYLSPDSVARYFIRTCLKP